MGLEPRLVALLQGAKSLRGYATQGRAYGLTLGSGYLALSGQLVV